jgi:hypothetical protein
MTIDAQESRGTASAPAVGRSRRIAVSIAVLTLTLVVGGSWLWAPLIAPGFVVRHSPFVGQALAAAAREPSCEAAFILRVDGWGSMAVPALVRGLASGDARVRVSAARGLAVCADPSAIDGLAAALSDGEAEVRRACARALGNTASQYAVNPAIQALADPDKGTRLAAIAALGRLRDPDAINQLKYFLTDSDIPTRVAASAAIGSIGDPQGIEHLVPLLKEHEIAIPAVRAIGAIGDDKAVAALFDVLKGDDDTLSLYAARSLERLRLSAEQALTVDRLIRRRAASGAQPPNDHTPSDLNPESLKAPTGPPDGPPDP